MSTSSINPATGELIGQFVELDQKELDKTKIRIFGKSRTKFSGSKSMPAQ